MAKALKKQQARLQSRIRGFKDTPGRKSPGSMNRHKGTFAPGGHRR